MCDADSFALRSAAASAGCADEEASKHIGYLYRLSLINRLDDVSINRFVLHPLLRLFARELADELSIVEDAGERHARYFIDLVKSIDLADAATLAAIAKDVGETLMAAKWLLSHDELDYRYLMSLEPILARFGHWLEAADMMAEFLSVAEAKGDSERPLFRSGFNRQSSYNSVGIFSRH